MTDTVTSNVRSRMMAAIRSKDTKPELEFRRRLHALGFRYSLHSARFSGRPDILLPKHCAAIFVHGCYWHGHDCGETKPASSNRSYWLPKIAKNRERDAQNLAAIERAGWRYLVVWECSFRRKGEHALDEAARLAADWITSGGPSAELVADNTQVVRSNGRSAISRSLRPSTIVSRSSSESS